jgi:hypothetical protein
MVCSARYSTAHVQYTPNTIAVAAVRSAMAAKGITWRVDQKDKDADGSEVVTKVGCLEFFVRRMSFNSRMDLEFVDLDQAQRASPALCQTAACTCPLMFAAQAFREIYWHGLT